MNMEDLYRGYARWMWVIEHDADGWLVSKWDGKEERYSALEYEAKPDLEYGPDGQRVPVIRTIGTGKTAQYFRFERKAVS
jgi:hypothetical protein